MPVSANLGAMNLYSFATDERMVFTAKFHDKGTGSGHLKLTLSTSFFTCPGSFQSCSTEQNNITLLWVDNLCFMPFETA